MRCLDANMLIEIILGRKYEQSCRNYISATTEDLVTTMLSVDLVMYFAENKKLEQKKVEEFLRLFIWLPMTDQDGEWAFSHFNNDDFEDAMQISCAIREGCSRFATLDGGISRKYSNLIAIDFLRK